MTDLRKESDEVLAEREACAKMCDDICLKYSKADDYAERVASQWCAAAIRARSETPPVKSYCGGKPNYCTPVDAVNMSQEPVDETAKREQEPIGYINGIHGGYMVFTPLNPSAVYLNGTALYTAPPISDYHEGWEEGFKAAKREWVGLTDEEISALSVSAGIISWTKHDYLAEKKKFRELPIDEGMDGDKACLLQFAQLIEAKLKEKNGG